MNRFSEVVLRRTNRVIARVAPQVGLTGCNQHVFASGRPELVVERDTRLNRAGEASMGLDQVIGEQVANDEDRVGQNAAERVAFDIAAVSQTTLDLLSQVEPEPSGSERQHGEAEAERLIRRASKLEERLQVIDGNHVLASRQRD
jgi:hypothetical protein